MLSLRSAEVSVLTRMNVQGRRRISLPAKLAGITEKVQSDNSDVQVSLQTSYSQMKSKIDQLEEYNHRLEEQLSNIFTSISESINKADESSHLQTRPIEKLKHIIKEDDYKVRKISTHSSFTPRVVKTGTPEPETNRFEEEKHTKLILILEEEMLKPNILKKNQQKNSQVTIHSFRTKSYKTTKEHSNLTTYSETNNILRKSGNQFSSIENPPTATLAEKKIFENRGRISAVTDKATVEKKLIDTLYTEKRGEALPFQNTNVTSSRVETKVNSLSEESIENMSLSSSEYLNFHDESEGVDEFFLFSENILNMDFDTVWEELAIFSEDLGNVLKAATASNKWKTLWIF